MPSEASSLPTPTPELRRVAVGQFERANQVLSSGNYDYAIRLLLECCKIDPTSLIYRQALRLAQKKKWKENQRGSWIAWLTNVPARGRLKRAMLAGKHVSVLEFGEQVLTRNPWDARTHVTMAEAAQELGLTDVAAWLLEQAKTSVNNIKLLRVLAQAYESLGNFAEALKLWDRIHKLAPRDAEAAGKVKDLAASATIVAGHYDSPDSSGKSGRMPKSDALEAEAGTPPLADRSGPASSRQNVGERKSVAEEETPADRRLAREAAPLQAKIEADPTNPHAYLQLAGLYRRAGQLDLARSTLHRALGPTGNNFDIAMEIVDLEIEPFRHNLAITEERLKDGADEELRRLRIRLLKEINTRELDLFRQKSDRYPSEMSHRFEMGVRLLRAGQIDEAIRELQHARTDPKQLWRALLYLGHCFRARQNWKLARRNFEDALKNVPATEVDVRKELYFQLAQGCAEAGDHAEAVEFGHELANLDFTYRGIGRLIDEWQTKIDTAQ